MKDKLTASFKLAARKLFSKAFGYTYVAAVSTIKLRFSTFNASQAVQWYNLIDVCEAELQKQEAATVKPQTLEEAITELRAKYGMYVEKTETFLGESYTIGYKNHTLGRIGFREDRLQYFYSFGRNGYAQLRNTVEEVVQGFLRATSANYASLAA